MRSKLVASLAATFLLLNVGPFRTYAQEAKEKKPAHPKSDVSQLRQAPTAKVLVVRPKPGTQEKPFAERPKVEFLAEADRLRMLRGGYEELPPLEPAATTIYFAQYAPQIVSEKGWFAYHNPKQVDTGLAYFWGDPGSGFCPPRNEVVDFVLYAESGHRYLVEFLTGWAAGKRKFRMTGAGNNQTSEFPDPGIGRMYAVVDLQSAPSGWYSIRIESVVSTGFGGQWFFMGVVVYTLA